MATLNLTKEILQKFYYWREFLKKSTKYKRIHNLLHSRMEEHPISNPLVYSWCHIHPELRQPYYDWLFSIVRRDERFSLYNEDGSYWHILYFVYPLFQNIYSDNQVEQMEQIEHRVKLFYQMHSFTPIGSAKYAIVGCIADTIEQISPDDKIDMERIIDKATEQIDRDYGAGKLYNTISFDPSLPDEFLLSQFKQYLKTTRKTRAQSTRKNPLFISPKGHRTSLLEALLVLLNRLHEKGSLHTPAKQEAHLEEIFYEDYPNENLDKSTNSNWKTLRRHRDLAFELIARAENGPFPGPFTAPPKSKGIIRVNEYFKIQHLIEASTQ
jgi:hypothetical protein